MKRVRRSRRHAEAFAPFFAAAAGFGLLAVPLWALAWRGAVALPYSPTPLLHAHEMVAGYALAVVAGFLFTKVNRRALGLALLAWGAGRALAVIDVGPGWPAALLSLAFPALLFAFAGMPFLRATRSAHNAIFAPLLLGFLLAEALTQAGLAGLLPAGPRHGVALGLDLIVLLLLVMGGRVIPAATAGALRARGLVLGPRVQPPLEWLGIGAMASVAALDAAAVLPGAAAFAAAVAGASVLARLARWKSRLVLDRPELWSLHLGYAWLGAGLLLRGAAQGLDLMTPADAAHGLAVGALGTLTLAMMARTALQRRGAEVAFPPVMVAAILLVSAAACLRLVAPAAGSWAILAAAGAWSLAQALFLVFLAGVLRRTGAA